MAIVISGVNNNDKITASDGTIDLLSGVSYASTITAPAFTTAGEISAGHINIPNNIQLGQAGVVTATTFVGNLTGNVNATSNLLLQIGGSEKFRVASSGQLGIGGANYGTSGQVLTSGGSGSAATWSTITGTTINNNADNRVITGSGSANTLEGEANLTWDGTTLLANKASGVGYIASKGGTSGGDYGIVQVQSGSTVRGRLVSDAAVDAFRLDSAGRASAPITFHTGSSYTEGLRIDSGGRIFTGNDTTLCNSERGSLHISGGGTSGSRVSIRGTATGAGNGLAEVFAFWDTNKVAGMIAFAGEDTTNKDDGKLNFYTADGSGVQARLKISKEGYVTKPAQPCASMTIDSSTISGNYMSHSSVHTNIGNHYNTGTSIFTCPVAGLYYVSIMVMSNNNDQTMDLEFQINGSNSNHILVPYQAGTGGSYNQVSGSTIVSCPANAQLRFKLNSGSIYGGRHSNMTFALFA